MLRKAGLTEKKFDYHANGNIKDWPSLLATLCILSNEDLHIRTTIEMYNEANK